MKKLIVGNWKMNPQSVKDAESLVKNISKMTSGLKNVDVVICPPFPFLSSAKKVKSTKISLGAQNTSYEISGAHTGEVSISMLKTFGVTHIIVGHSERRSIGETDEVINKKLLAVLKSKITPILCVGESIRANDGAYLSVVKDQLIRALEGIQKVQIKQIVIAYEPVWALSTTENRHDATAHDFEEMKIYIRKILSDMFSLQIASQVRIIYGGSVNKDNALSFLSVGAEGLLPGKASLDARNFSEIVKIASALK